MSTIIESIQKEISSWPYVSAEPHRSVKYTIDKIIAEKDRIDILVNNAGYRLFSPIEDVTLDQLKEQF
jgi:NAD(P)-dependent dehydrogenase (short-subunit alcohol dehydrogenase family)